jgi:hypothetical protein
MTDTKTRNAVRKVQDKIIQLADERGYDEYMRISNDMPNTITLNSIRMYIYPDYLRELEAVLYALESTNRR